MARRLGTLQPLSHCRGWDRELQAVGRGGGGVRRAVGDSHLLLPPTLQDGRLLQGSALLPRGHQLHVPQLRDRSLPPPDLPEGPDSQDGLLADTGARYFTRYDLSDNF